MGACLEPPPVLYGTISDGPPPGNVLSGHGTVGAPSIVAPIIVFFLTSLISMAQQGFGGDGSGDTGVHHVSPNTNVAASNATAPMSEGGYNNSSCSDKPASAGGIATRYWTVG